MPIHQDMKVTSASLHITEKQRFKEKPQKYGGIRVRQTVNGMDQETSTTVCKESHQNSNHMEVPAASGCFTEKKQF